MYTSVQRSLQTNMILKLMTLVWRLPQTLHATLNRVVHSVDEPKDLYKIKFRKRS